MADVSGRLVNPAAYFLSKGSGATMNVQFGGSASSLLFWFGFFLLLILPLLRSIVRRLFPEAAPSRFWLFSAISAWWSGLNFAVRNILEWFAVCVGLLWMIAATCALVALEILLYWNPEMATGPVFPPGNLLLFYAWISVGLFAAGVFSLGKTEFDEGATRKILGILKTAALGACLFLSVLGVIFLIIAAISGPSSLFFPYVVLVLLCLGLAGYSAMNR
ncbi:MAG: hypothetical protein JW929_11845 [Anaerolineales bacterium]|nr:hypothetical protein [Anaerolineales bacterium]